MVTHNSKSDLPLTQNGKVKAYKTKPNNISIALGGGKKLCRHGLFPYGLFYAPFHTLVSLFGLLDWWHAQVIPILSS